MNASLSLFRAERGQQSLHLPTELVVDNFAGGGGASIGIERALGRPVDVAINHDPDAIAMHMANHPWTEHFIEDVWHVDPRQVTRGVPVKLAWFSPDCKHFSKARGGVPASKKIRGLAWVALRWVATVRPKVLMLENVEEFQGWGKLMPVGVRIEQLLPGKGRKGKPRYETTAFHPWEAKPGLRGHTFKAFARGFEPTLIAGQRICEEWVPDPKHKGRTFRQFINALQRHGYEVQWRELSACDFGAPTSRKRFFLIARRDGQPIVWPTPTHGEGREFPYRTAAECIEWEHPCPSIFDRERQLAKATLRRTALGIARYVLTTANPFVVRTSQTGFNSRGAYGLDEPLTTIVSKAEHCFVSPQVVKLNVGYERSHDGDQGEEQRPHPMNHHVGPFAPLLTKFRTGSTGQDLTRPMPTITAGGDKSDHPGGNGHALGLVAANLRPLAVATPWDEGAPPLCAPWLAKHFGGVVGQRADQPTSTITSIDHHGLVTSRLLKFNGSGQDAHRQGGPAPMTQAADQRLAEVRSLLHRSGEVDPRVRRIREFLAEYVDWPKQKVSAAFDVDLAKLGIVVVEGAYYQIVDIGLRMLEPAELYRAQGFPEGYQFECDLQGRPFPKYMQVARCGNSVSPVMSEALVRANFPEAQRLKTSRRSGKREAA